MSQPDDYFVDPQRRPLTGFDEIKPPVEVPAEEPDKTSWLKGFTTDIAQRSWLVNDPIAIGNKLETLSELTKAGLSYDFNPVQDKYLNLVPSEYAHKLATAATEGEVFRRVAMIQREIDNREILNTAPVTSIIAGGFADVATTPWFWIPIAGGLTSAKFGTEVLQSAGRAAVSFGVSEAISETNLQKAQLTRSMQESISNVAMATMLGGLFGGAGGVYRSAELPFYKKMVSETLGGALVKLHLNKNYEVDGLVAHSGSAGAMQAQFIDMPGSRLLGWGKDGKLRPARPLIWALGKFGRNPVILGLSSKSPTVVWFTSKTYEHNMDVVKNVIHGKNIEQSLQTKMRDWEAKGILASIKMNRFYAEYLGLDPTKVARNIAKRKFSQFPGMLNFADFQREIMIGITSGEPLTNPIMSKAAKELYQEFYEPVTKELIALEILAPDIKPAMAVQYINRVYDQAYMIANPKKTKDFLRDAYTKTNEKIVAVREQEILWENQIEELTNLLNSLPAELDETRKMGKIFHGTRKEIIGIPNEYYSSSQNIYGHGFYTTEALDIAKGYAKKNGHIYEIKTNLTDKDFYNIDKSLDQDILSEIIKTGGSDIEDAVESTLKSNPSLTEILDEFRAITELSTDEAQMIISDIQYLFAKKGYKGFTHTGGVLTNHPFHKVKIFFTPQEDIQEIIKMEFRRKPIQDEILTLKKNLASEKKKINNKVQQGKFTPDMLTGDAGMSYAEQKALKQLRKPIMQIKKAIKHTEQELAVHKRKINPDRKPGQSNVPADEIQKTLENTLKQQKETLQSLRSDIETKIDTGLIPEKFYFTKNTGERYLKKPDRGTLKLRPLLNETEVGTAAETTYKTLTGQTEEQLLQTLLDSAQLGSGGQNPLMPRSLMIADKDLYSNRLLSSDFASTVRTFNLRMGRLIEMRKMLENRGYDPKQHGTPLAWLAYKIEQEYSAFSSQLAAKQLKELEGVTGKELEKLEQTHRVENANLAREMERDLKITSLTYQRITGTVPRTRKELLAMARMSNNYSYATQLGALALLIAQDLVSPIFNHGAVHWIKGGVLPFVDMVTIASKKHKALVKDWMSDLMVGIETESALYGLAHDVRDKVEFASGWLDRNLAAAATTMGIINFSTAFGSLATKIAAHTSMSGNMRRLTKMIEGRASKSELIALGNLGLRDEKIAAVILDQFQKHGERLRGSYVPGWEKWGTTETDAAYQKLVAHARETFMGAISKDIRSTIFSGNNIASYPLELDPNGLSKAFLTYMGWMFNATANYTVPLLQRYDQNRVNGLIAMWAASCMVEPLRSLTRGKEPDLDPATVFKKGLLNSGALGLPLSLFNTANSMGRVAKDLQLDRYKYRDRGLSLSAGAPGTLLGAAANFLGMAVNNDWNQKELNELSRTIPFAYTIEFRAILNKAIESLPVKEKPERGKD